MTEKLSFNQAMDRAARAMAKLEGDLAGMRKDGTIDILIAGWSGSEGDFAPDVGIFLSMRGDEAAEHTKTILAASKDVQAGGVRVIVFPKPK